MSNNREKKPERYTHLHVTKEVNITFDTSGLLRKLKPGPDADAGGTAYAYPDFVSVS